MNSPTTLSYTSCWKRTWLRQSLTDKDTHKTHTHTHTHVSTCVCVFVCVCVYVYIYTYICIYVCIYMYMYIYIYIHIYIYISLRNIWHSHINRSRWRNVGILFLTGANRLRRIHCPFLLHYRVQISISTDDINLLKPTVYAMNQQVYHSTFVRSAHTVFMRFVFIWEQTATCATYSINWLVFITEMKSVYCAVRTRPSSSNG